MNHYRSQGTRVDRSGSMGRLNPASRSLVAWASGFYLHAKHLAGKLTEESAFQISLTLHHVLD